jgi:hypothetical protein
VRICWTSAFSIAPVAVPLNRLFNHLLYCYKRIPLPEGGTTRRHHPPRLQSGAPCLPLPVRQRWIPDLRESCSQTPSRNLCHSCTRVSKARCPDRGNFGMLGSRCDSVRSRRASVRGSPLNVGSDTSQPRPRVCSCTHDLVCREEPGTRPAPAATVMPSEEGPFV